MTSHLGFIKRILVPVWTVNCLFVDDYICCPLQIQFWFSPKVESSRATPAHRQATARSKGQVGPSHVKLSFFEAARGCSLDLELIQPPAVSPPRPASLVECVQWSKKPVPQLGGSGGRGDLEVVFKWPITSLALSPIPHHGSIATRLVGS